MNYFFSLIFILVCVVLNAQSTTTKPGLKSVSQYLLKDSTNLFNLNQDELKKYIRNSRYYDKEGRLVKEIAYPFRDAENKELTKKTSKIYTGDTTYVTITNGFNKKVSKSKYVTDDEKNIESFRKQYASLNSSFYTPLEEAWYIYSKSDSAGFVSQITRTKLKDPLDTLSHVFTDTNPVLDIPMKRESIYHDPDILNNVRYSFLSNYGYVKTNLQGDTTEVHYSNKIIQDSSFAILERLTIDLEKDRLRKEISSLEDDKVFKKEAYELISGEWIPQYKVWNQYNERNDIVIKIRDDYREGIFSYRFVNYTIYEYYEGY